MTMTYEESGNFTDTIGDDLNLICKQVERVEVILSKLQREAESAGATDEVDALERALDELGEIQSSVEAIDAAAREVESESIEVARDLFAPDPSQWTYSERLLLAELAEGLGR